MSAQDLEQRAQFEEWVRKRHGLSVEVWDDSGKYKYGNTHHFWECWKVAAALRQQPAPAIIDNAGEVASAEQALYPECWRLDDRELNAARLKALHRGLELSQKWSRGTGAHGHTGRMVRDMADELRMALSSQDGDYAHQPAPVVDDELPGMWSQSDFTGGATDAADDARQLVPSVDDAMVDRYLAAQAKAVHEIDDAWGNGGKAASYLHPVREACRAGLTAGLTAALTVARTVRLGDDALLIAEVEAAADRFESLSRTFARMTDRYGDGEACTERAYRLRAALARAQEVQS